LKWKTISLTWFSDFWQKSEFRLNKKIYILLEIYFFLHFKIRNSPNTFGADFKFFLNFISPDDFSYNFFFKFGSQNDIKRVLKWKTVKMMSNEFGSEKQRQKCWANFRIFGKISKFIQLFLLLKTFCSKWCKNCFEVQNSRKNVSADVLILENVLSPDDSTKPMHNASSAGKQV
jgi:hypothetical protein